MNETADSDRELLHRLRKLLESGDIDTIANL
jgi:ATP-dependent helicase/nuclease subunit A